MKSAAAVLAALTLGALLAAGCGSSSKSSVAVITETHTVTAPAQTPSTSGSSSTTTTATTPATATPTGPASANGTPGSGTLAAAEKTVTAKGFTPTVTYGYDPKSTLSVIVASSGKNQMQAFFFVNGRYIGTDTKNPSAGITLQGHDDTSATLSYALYGPKDALCCPVKTVKVTYALDNGKLEPQGEIPTDAPGASLSRR